MIATSEIQAGDGASLLKKISWALSVRWVVQLNMAGGWGQDLSDLRGSK